MGIDTASYASSSGGVTVFLDGTAGVGGDAAGDTLDNVENLVGSGFDDLLFDGAGANSINGGDGRDNIVALNGGSDTLNGGDENDIIFANDGAVDTIDGGAGIDLLSFTNASAALTIDLATPANSSAVVSQDVVSNIEGYLGAASFANTFVGDGNNNFYLGGAQSDVISGGDGADYLVGLGGDDTINGGTGFDVIDGGAGLDLLFGGADQDAFQIILNAGTEVAMDWTGAGGDGDGDIFLLRGTGESFANLTGTFVDHASGDIVGGYTVSSTVAASFVVGSGGSATTVVVEGATALQLDDAANFLFL